MKALIYAGMVTVAVAGLSGAAQAAETLGGHVTMTQSLTDPNRYTGGFTVTHTGAFEDTWTFGPLPAGLASASLISIGFDAFEDINFSNVTLNGTPLTLVNTGPLSSAFTASELFSSGGINTLIVSGTSGAGATYSGTINYRLTGAVPEPATWALMILGFGAVGAAMRRRKTNVTVSYA